MFEILADPAAIALAGSIGGGILLKGGETLLKKRKKPEPPVMEYKDSSAYKLDNPTVWDCAVFEQRQFEKKLVKEKVLAAVETRCEDKKCPECYPNRPGNGAPPTLAPDRVRRKEAPEIGTTNNTKKWRERPVHDASRADRAKAEKRRAAEAFAKSRAGKQRVAEVSGRVVPLPNNVPKFATGQLIYDSGMLSSFIGWRWHDEDDPNKPLRSFRQNVSDEVFDSFPLAGKKEPFTTKGGNQMVACRVCTDTYYIRSGMAPAGVFTCKKCKDNTPHRNTLPRPPKGAGAGSPVKNIDAVLKTQQYEIDEYKKRIDELEYLVKNNFITANEARQKYGTKNTWPR